MTALINLASNVFCAAILFAEFPSCRCWRRGVIADLLILLFRHRQGWKTSCGGCGWCCCWRVRFSGGCDRCFVKLFWVAEDNSVVAALWDCGDSNSVWLCGLLVVRSGGGGWMFDLPMVGRGWNWSVRRHRWRSTAAGVGDLLWLRVVDGVYLWIDVVVLAVIGVEGRLIGVFHIAAFWGWIVNNEQCTVVVFFFSRNQNSRCFFFWTVTIFF